jgi:hypothetical protein
VSGEIIAFRHLLRDELARLLEEEEMGCADTADALVEIVTSVSRYLEEGTVLFPLVFVCDDLAALLRTVGGREARAIGVGERSAATARRALKACAPLASDAWSIYFERAPDGALRYGMFRTDGFVLVESPMEILRATRDRSLHAIGVVQLGDSVVELRTGSGLARYVYLSGSRSDAPSRAVFLRGLLTALVRDVPEPLRADTWTFFRRVFVEARRAGHGSLVAVIPADAPVPTIFADGILLDDPIDVAGAVARYHEGRAEDARARLQALGGLLAGMMGVDGITLLRTDGVIAGYNVFVPHPSEASSSAPVGGARRRTYQLLAAAVGTELAAAFYRSQDGHMECASVT